MELFSVSDVAKTLKVSKYTLRLWLRKGKIKGTKLVGDTWRVSKEDLDRFLEEGRNHADTNSDVQES